MNHPQVQWVQWDKTPRGFALRCTVCGAQGTAQTPQQADAFAAEHQAHPGARGSSMGLGDAVAKVTGALGVKPCEPCKKRQAQLNGIMPRVWPFGRR